MVARNIQNKMKNKSITLIGAGHLGSALIRGLVKSGYPAQSITVSNRNPSKSKRLNDELGTLSYESNLKAIEHADIIILAVKPQFMRDVCQEIAEFVQKKRPLIISMAGVTDINTMNHWLGVSDLGIIRVMTNTPMEFQKGISALFANTYITPKEKELSEAIFAAVGATFWVDSEALIDILTAAIGSAPAYVFLFMEALQEAAISRGIPAELATQVALEVVSGAAELVRHSGRTFADLRAGVTTPNGITEHSLKKLSTDDFFDTFKTVYEAAEERIEEIKK